MDGTNCLDWRTSGLSPVPLEGALAGQVDCLTCALGINTTSLRKAKTVEMALSVKVLARQE